MRQPFNLPGLMLRRQRLRQRLRDDFYLRTCALQQIDFARSNLAATDDQYRALTKIGKYREIVHNRLN